MINEHTDEIKNRNFKDEKSACIHVILPLQDMDLGHLAVMPSYFFLQLSPKYLTKDVCLSMSVIPLNPMCQIEWRPVLSTFLFVTKISLCFTS